MKQVTISPGVTVPVSDEALARARNALKTFGITEKQLLELAAYVDKHNIDITHGKLRRLANIEEAGE